MVENIIPILSAEYSMASPKLRLFSKGNQCDTYILWDQYICFFLKVGGITSIARELHEIRHIMNPIGHGTDVLQSKSGAFSVSLDDSRSAYVTRSISDFNFDEMYTRGDVSHKTLELLGGYIHKFHCLLNNSDNPDYFDDNSIVHGDLNFGNIFLSEADGNLKFIDSESCKRKLASDLFDAALDISVLEGDRMEAEIRIKIFLEGFNFSLDERIKLSALFSKYEKDHYIVYTSMGYEGSWYERMLANYPFFYNGIIL
jgi:serine/threonine protein kinase